MTRPLRIGIVGARGIGKHHAKWFARAGCEVTAVYGTTPASASAAAAALREQLGFSGRAFHEWDRFRAEGGFDAASVCSPPEAHFANVRDLAADGRHILCEKPLVWNWSYSPLRIIEEATALVESAARHGVLLGVNAQYPAALEGLTALHERVAGAPPAFRRLAFVMETKNPPRSPHGPAEAWVDLGAHPLAFLDAVCPGGVDWKTLRHRDGPAEAILDFDWICGERRIPIHLECRRTAGGAVRRRIETEALSVEVGATLVDGEFAARLATGREEWIGPDFMQVSVERFVEAVRTGEEGRLLVSGTAALRQQEALVGVWKHCWR